MLLSLGILSYDLVLCIVAMLSYLICRLIFKWEGIFFDRYVIIGLGRGFGRKVFAGWSGSNYDITFPLCFSAGFTSINLSKYDKI